MLDAHCHVDRYDDPKAIANAAAAKGVFTIAMTNLPSHFREGLRHTKGIPRLRLSLGLHPLCAEHHEAELSTFYECLQSTSFIGEIGLDFSRHAVATRERQTETFTLIARALSGSCKFISLHTRRADSEVLSILRKHNITPAVFHWYSGSVTTLKKAVDAGHYFSINPAMIITQRGRNIIDQVPRERLLTESDGPYAMAAGRKACRPWDVGLVEQFLADKWKLSNSQTSELIWSNFKSLLYQLKLTSPSR